MGIWVAGRVKTTLDIPDDLFREAKAKAALEGRKLKDLVTEGLRLRMRQGPRENLKLVKFPLIKSKSKRPLKIPDDIASRLESADDLKRHESFAQTSPGQHNLTEQSPASSRRRPLQINYGLDIR